MLENPTICHELYKDKKTCVDQEHLSLFLNNIYNYVHYKDSAVINSLYDDIKEISGKFEND